MPEIQFLGLKDPVLRLEPRDDDRRNTNAAAGAPPGGDGSSRAPRAGQALQVEQKA